MLGIHRRHKWRGQLKKIPWVLKKDLTSTVLDDMHGF